MTTATALKTFEVSVREKRLTAVAQTATVQARDEYDATRLGIVAIFGPKARYGESGQIVRAVDMHTDNCLTGYVTVECDEVEAADTV